ncbi:MAG TPA: hypothetical protein VHZ09_01220 [Acidobacteriaceae bacterium]|jgi:hypothetical protein|nr:hypothetical protein [Acidobacteriaceae bacterium]
MVSRFIVAAWGCAALFALSCQAQSDSPQSQPAPTATQQAAQQSDEQPSQPAQTQPAPLQFQDLPPDAHTPTPAEMALQRQQQALAAAERLASVQAHWGPDMSSPGLSISLTEASREKMPDGSTEITYHITGSGFAATDRLALVRWELNSQSQMVMDGIAFDASGTAVCGTPQPNAAGPAGAAAVSPATTPGPNCTASMHPGEPIPVKTTAAAGEPIRVALIGADRKHGAATTAVPFPITNEDKGCRLSVLLGVKDAAMVLVEGTGFPPNTPLKLESTTLGETRTLNPKTSPDGRLIVIILPAAKGVDAGDTTVRFAGVSHPPSLQTSGTPPSADPDCKPSVTFHWGKGSYKLD